jgi:hypothetical protein
MPPAFFDFLFPGGGSSFLAVTFNFVVVPFTDINDDKKIDMSFSEIYYNNHFRWGINADPPVADVQTVALHEAGHGLQQGHFGKIFIDNNGQVQFAPYAVMNAIIFGQHQNLEGSDIGGQCLIWGSWPNH